MSPVNSFFKVTVQDTPFGELVWGSGQQQVKFSGFCELVDSGHHSIHIMEISKCS